ncbi:MAG: pyridoxamine 5'-phosphate oxidase family protein [Actinomycetota bacterium]
MTWRDLELADPQLAAAGAPRLHGLVAYLATVSSDGAPRVHPVTPIVGGGHLFVFMEPTSPKGADLRRGSRYGLHSAVGDPSGKDGEFLVRGIGAFVGDPGLRAVAERHSTYSPATDYVLFELAVEGAMLTEYVNGRPVRRRFPS